MAQSRRQTLSAQIPHHAYIYSFFAFLSVYFRGFSDSQQWAGNVMIILRRDAVLSAPLLSTMADLRKSQTVRALVKMCNRKIIFLFLNQNICCGYSKEPSQRDGSFEHPKHMLKVIGKKLFTILS